MRTLRLLAAGALLGAIVVIPSAVAAPAHRGSPLHCAPIGTAGRAGAGGSHIDVLDSLAQVLPTRHRAGGSGAHLCQARNAFESFQIEVTARAHALKGVRMTASALNGPGNARIPAGDVRLSREGYVRLREASDGELADVVHRNAAGQCLGDCRFPDPLIPDVDPLFHEKRNAFPFSVPKGENRAVWVDVQVPTAQRAGRYTGAITIGRSAGKLARVPITLRVLPTALPSTSSIGGPFFLTLGGGRVPVSRWPRVYREFAELGLDNRITITPNNTIPVHDFDATFGHLLAGTDPRTLLPGARLTAFPVQPGWAAGDIAAYYSKLKAAGARASFYCDEVPSPTCADAYTTGTADAAGLPFSPIDYPGRANWEVPDPIDPENTVAPEIRAAGPTSSLIVYIDALQSKVSGSRLPGFRTWQAAGPGRQVWAYTACPSAGCSKTNRYSAHCPGCQGTVSYGIDQYASEQRAMGWQLFIHRLQGELYYSVDGQLDISANPMRSGVNGDGTLFYSSNGKAIDGTNSIPLESIRLKRIRDGRQDYELLTRAVGRSPAAAQTARHIASTLFPTFYRSAVSAQTFDAARQKLVALLR